MKTPPEIVTGTEPQPPPAVVCSALLAAKYCRRDELLRSVWSIMRDISDHGDEAKMSDEDLAVWGEVTAHSAIQARLNAALKSQQAANDPSSAARP